MYIVEILSQNRRDFKALYKCEGCEAKMEMSGYDDSNFHSNVVPMIGCKACGQSSEELGMIHGYRKTKYAEGEQV